MLKQPTSGVHYVIQGPTGLFYSGNGGWTSLASAQRFLTPVDAEILAQQAARHLFNLLRQHVDINIVQLRWELDTYAYVLPREKG